VAELAGREEHGVGETSSVIYESEAAGDNPARRMLDLVARRGPELMRAGGGSLPQGGATAITAAEVDRFRQLASTGMRVSKIARLCARSPRAVRLRLKSPEEIAA
jgi:hypothetical protein